MCSWRVGATGCCEGFDVELERVSRFGWTIQLILRLEEGESMYMLRPLCRVRSDLTSATGRNLGC